MKRLNIIENKLDTILNRNNNNNIYIQININNSGSNIINAGFRNNTYPQINNSEHNIINAGSRCTERNEISGPDDVD